MTPKTLALVLLLCVVASTGAVLAQSFGDADRYFGLEWTGASAADGRTSTATS